MYNYSTITDVHFEPTQKCQASCAMCDRNKNGGEVNQYLKNADISLNDFKSIMPVSFIKQLKNIYFCGNHGDPIFAPELLDIIKFIRSNNKDINIGITTNGGARTTDWWEELAKYVNHVNFSVDGLWDTNHIYRRGVNWANVESNMDTFISAGGKARWTFLVFEYNERQIEKAKEYSELLGVDKFIVKKSGRFIVSGTNENLESRTVIDRKTNEELYRLGKPKNPLYQNTETENKHEQIIQEFGSLESFYNIAKIKPKCEQKQEIYISAEGLVFPCCWTAGEMYKWYNKMEDSEMYSLLSEINSINAVQNDLQSIINGQFFDKIKSSWNIETCDKGKLNICSKKCNEGFDPFNAQWN